MMYQDINLDRQWRSDIVTPENFAQQEKIMTSEKMSSNDARAQSHFYEGALRFSLELFGDQLAKREGYHELAGVDAVRYYLMLKFRWLPREVKALSFDDLRFAMAEEISGWTIPPEAQSSYPAEHVD